VFSQFTRQGVAIGALVFATAAAASPGTALPADTAITESELVAWVLEANANLASLRAAAEAATFRIDPAGSLDDPMLSYGAAPRTAGSGRFNQRVEFSQRIPWPGTLKAREAVAGFEAAAVAGSVDALRLEVAAQTRSAHAQWRFVREALAIHHET